MITISVQHTPQNGTRFNWLDRAAPGRSPALSPGQPGRQTEPQPASKPRPPGRFDQKRSTNGDHDLLEALAGSKIFHEYERAFSDATGMPLTLRPTETWQLPLHGKRHEGPFCSLMSQKSRTCASCLQMQQKLSETATSSACTMTCPAGLSDSAIPVRLGTRLIGFLQTGQVFRKRPTQAQFERTMSLLESWGVEINREQLHKAYFATRVLDADEHEAVIKLLTIFAQHLSMLTNQLAVQRDNAEPPAITRARQYIQEHQAEDLRLEQVAKAVNMSHFYFCKMFRKVAGLNFTDYLARVRIEKAKNLLLNPNLRVSEIAYEVGFQSLTHFNRVFKRIVGESPSDYREQLLGA